MKTITLRSAGLNAPLSKNRPVIYSWVPIDLNAPSTKLTIDLPAKKTVVYNPFNIIDSGLSRTTLADENNVVYPGGRPLSSSIQNKITQFYSDTQQETLLTGSNITYKSVFTEEEELDLWFTLHAGDTHSAGGVLNINRINWPYYKTLARKEILHPSLDSLIPYIFKVPNNPKLIVEVNQGIDIDSVTPLIPSKIFLAARGTTTSTKTEVEITSEPYFYSTITEYTRINSATELRKRAVAPINKLYIDYRDPVLKFLLHPSASISWTKLQYSLEAFGYTGLINNIPQILCILITDSEKYTMLRGSGSRLEDETVRTLDFCRELYPRGWYTHAFKQPGVISDI